MEEVYIPARLTRAQWRLGTWRTAYVYGFSRTLWPGAVFDF